jgi:flagellar biosynthesis regulator FlaF
MDKLDMFISNYSSMLQQELPDEVRYEYSELYNLLVELSRTRQKLQEEIDKTANMMLVVDDPADLAAIQFTNQVLNAIAEDLTHSPNS